MGEDLPQLVLGSRCSLHSSCEMPKENKSKLEQFMTDLLVGGISGAVAKTGMAPIERVKILMQTQDSNPKILSGEEKRYSGLVDCFKRVNVEQGPRAFWRGNLVN